MYTYTSKTKKRVKLTTERVESFPMKYTSQFILCPLV
jgi:hypothetical protein